MTNVFAYMPETDAALEIDLIAYNFVADSWESGPRTAYGVNGLAKALLDMTQEYLHPIDTDGVRDARLAPSLAANLVRHKHILQISKERAEFTDQVEEWAEKVSAAEKALQDAAVMDEFVTGLDPMEIAAESEIPEDPRLRDILEKDDEANMLNLVYRYLSTLIDFELDIEPSTKVFS